MVRPGLVFLEGFPDTFPATCPAEVTNMCIWTSGLHDDLEVVLQSLGFAPTGHKLKQTIHNMEPESEPEPSLRPH